MFNALTHYKRRRLANLEYCLKVLEAERKAGPGTSVLSVPDGCGASSTILKPMGTPATTNGLRTGVMPTE